ncbi:Trehalose 6-phosphate synthase, family GT20 / Trehalose 6-phosphate phosphatase [Ectocarpus siliculosus]|uniref:Trehalose 6-phosphate synthase, family GT20 / Trehalose 6-phosphate phosphatase n=1 Tax=Ectocarpus siliculosus TaxID=2880 RepID=D7FL73_ECTSI|nr:Trehalose 6-phosphate synthase, family GT20 / Trehalose 6-phosphate phosphatase [Ectocarpus siliculosus]|eukprot:CBJ29609.1 Trehalose 6-phosphate synthase, family GT20 / Trehalose 6-phosphate phosphatase [Ectocarpus siliculosus]
MANDASSSIMPTRPPPAYELSFAVEAKLGHGEVIYVCGSCPSLGAKDPSRALRLVTDPSSYPVWSSGPVPVPLNKKVTYRYCVVAGGKLKRWEDISVDRELDPVTEPSAATAIVEDVLDKYKGKGGGGFLGGFFRGSRVPKGDMRRSVKFAAANRTSLQASMMALRAKTAAKEKSSAITKRDGVVVVSFFLPVLLSKDEGGRWVVEWDYESLLSLHSTDVDMRGILWPVFHHVVDVYGDQVMRFFTQDTMADLWQCYANVNRRFRDKIVEVYNEGDMIWVHGFHLLLLPSFLTRVLRTARVGLFLHTPFPSSEIFRTLPFREDLLRGMLNADQIGFHLFEYARHFITCCKRILGLNEGDSTNRGNRNVYYNGRCVSIESIHGGIEPSIIAAKLGHTDIAGRVAALRKEYDGRYVFLGIDKVERLKGLQLKFTAFYKLLLEYPHLADTIVLLQLGISVSEREQDYHKCFSELSTLAKKINSEFAPSPDRPVLVLELEDENSFTLNRRIPYLCLADCLLNTSVRDGLNSLPLEYVQVQGATRVDNPGVLMLSEFTSAMRVMRGAIRINPWKVEEVAHVMAEVVQVMTVKRRKERLSECLEYVNTNTTSYWAAQILMDLKAVGSSSNRSIMSPVGLGLNFRVVGMESNFSLLDVAALMRGYRSAKRRVIFLDYGGTICTTPKRSIAYYAHANKNLGLAAEHGLHFRFPGELKMSGGHLDTGGSTDTERDPSFVKRKWETLVALRDQSWKQLTRTIMNLYAQRTNGTYVVNKGSALLWQFRDADPEFGWLQSKELEDHLTTVLKPFSVEILRGTSDGDGGYIEVRPGGVNKGAFVSAILSRQVEMDLMPDFILAMGDEESDEMMYEVVKDFSRGVKGEEPGTPDATATTTQGGPTSPGRRGSYQVGATAAVLIASAAAELKRQQEEQLEKEVAEAEARSGGMGSQSHSAGRLPSATMVSASAPADINAATIAVMAGLEEKFSTAGLGEEKSVDGMMEHEAYFPLSGGSDGGGGGIQRGRASSLVEPGSGGGAATAMKPTSLTMKARVGPGAPRWRGGVLGTPGMGSSPGSGSIVGAGKLGVQCFTCTVGKKPSQARTYVNDIDEVLEMLRGLVKVSLSVSRNYSTSHLSDMRGRGRGGSANYDDLSLISAQFHAEASGKLDASGQGVPGSTATSGGMPIMKSLSVVVMPTHMLPGASAPMAPGTMSAYFDQIEEGDEDEGGIFF